MIDIELLAAVLAGFALGLTARFEVIDPLYRRWHDRPRPSES